MGGSASKEKVEAAGMSAGSPVGSAPGAGGEGEVVAALQALGFTAQEARTAARHAASRTPPGATLEDRVKAALTARGAD